MRETMEGLKARERETVIGGRVYRHLPYDTLMAMRLTGLGVFALIAGEKVARNTEAPGEVTPEAANRYLRLVEETLKLALISPKLGAEFNPATDTTDMAHIGDDALVLYAAIRKGDDDIEGFTMSSTGSTDTSAPPSWTVLPSGTE